MSEIRTYKCIVDFYVWKYDDDGFTSDEEMLIREGEVFQCDLGDSERIVGGRDTLKLVNDKQWLELTEETIQANFVEVVE